MAGMLPGVESARRRRFHMNSSGGGSRRSNFSLFAKGVEPHLSSSSSSIQRKSSFSKGLVHGGELGGVAREAKERLDEKLGTQQRSTEINQSTHVAASSVQREVFSKRNSKKFSWRKFGWKASEQRECAVCLENFRSGDVLVHLRCAHRFHLNCVMPWVKTNSHCPCCRMPVSLQI